MRISGHWTLEVRDPCGRLVSRRKERLHSFVRGFLDLLYAQMENTGKTVVDIGGTGRTVAGSPSNFNQVVYAGDDGDGLLVGTGTTAVAIGDYSIETLIAHGSGSGQLDYKVQTLVDPATVGSSRSFEIRRLFENKSGASITINEWALYADMGPSSEWTALMIREIVSGGQAVGDNFTANLVVTIKVTV